MFDDEEKVKTYIDKDRLLDYLRERETYYLSLGSIAQCEVYADVIDTVSYMSDFTISTNSIEEAIELFGERYGAE